MTITHCFSWKETPNTDIVQIAGSFNNWEPQLMERENIDDTTQALWKLNVELSSGLYEFKFVVNGNWILDSSAPQISNELGSFNNYIQVEDETADTDDNSKILKQKRRTIEIERKFSIDSKIDYHKILSTQLKFKQKTEYTIHDQYFDTPSYGMIQRDFWLRKRNGNWQLKHPIDSKTIVTNKSVTTSTKTTVYQETVNEKTIHRLITDKFSLPSRTNVLSDLVKCGHLLKFAEIKCDRTTFVRHGNEEGDNVIKTMNVVIDETDFGFKVGEIEVEIEVSSDEQGEENETIKLAERQIDSVARHLSCESLINS